MNNPSVAVVIPCRNEELYIERCIQALVNNSYPSELLHIYVCDGMSDDSTRNIISNIADKNQNVHLLDNKRQTTPYALNIGLKEAKADIKIILGAHSEVDKEFVAANVKAFESSIDIGCTGGVLENVYENHTAEVIGLAMSSSFGVGNAHFRTGAKDGYVDTVAFGAYKQEVFDKVGYFDESLTRNQDDEFNFRVLKNGFKIYLSNAIKCKYYVRGSYKKLFRQYYQYGYWKVFVNKKHRTVTTVRQLVPLFFVLFLIGGATISWIHPWFLYGYLGGLSLYILMALLSAIGTSASKSPQLVYTFFILHLSYGWGYLIGIFEFFLLGKNPSTSSEKLSR